MASGIYFFFYFNKEICRKYKSNAIILFVFAKCVFFLNYRPINKNNNKKNIPARLAFSPHVHVNFTRFSRIFASISLVFGDGPPKKAFTAFASQRIVVVTRGPVTTDQTQVFLRSHRPRRLLLLLLGLTLLTWLPANLLTGLPLPHGICKLK